jgi:predicted metal-dependent hydrolase
MDTPAESYDPRYLAGIVLFNRGAYFESHEVWEELWMGTAGSDKRFYQGLIQAAVGLCHFCNGNVRGAVKLYHSSRDYMSRYPSPHLGMDVGAFWGQMERCFAGLLANPSPGKDIVPDDELLPEISLRPPPTSWPDPSSFLAGDGGTLQEGEQA